MENKFFFVRKREISGLGSGDWNFFSKDGVLRGKGCAGGLFILMCGKGCAGGLFVLLREKRLRWRAVYIVARKRLCWRVVCFVAQKDYLKWVAGVALCAIPTLDTHRNDAHSLCGTPALPPRKNFSFFFL